MYIILVLLLKIQMIYFIETYTWKTLPYNVVHKANEFRWKDLYKKSSLRLAYDWPTENFETSDQQDVYEMYVDFIELLEFYNNK